MQSLDTEGQAKPSKEAALLAHVGDALSVNGYKYSVDDSNKTISLGFSGSMFNISVFIFCGSGFLTFQARLPIVVKEKHADRLTLLANDLSVSLPIGGFELNRKLGYFFFKVGRYTFSFPDKEEIDTMLSLAVSSIDSASAAVNKVFSE